MLRAFLKTLNRYLNISVSDEVWGEFPLHLLLISPHLAFSLCICIWSCLSICTWDKFAQFPMHLVQNTHVCESVWIAYFSLLSCFSFFIPDDALQLPILHLTSISTLKKLQRRPGPIITSLSNNIMLINDLSIIFFKRCQPKGRQIVSKTKCCSYKEYLLFWCLWTVWLEFLVSKILVGWLGKKILFKYAYIAIVRRKIQFYEIHE